jgi:hypothetical protein
MPRGRLINPFLAEIGRLDQVGTAADPDGPGPLTSGYDPVYRETVTQPSADLIGTDSRKEWPLVQIPAQFHTGPTIGQLMALKETLTGNVSTAFLQVLMHFDDLERLLLVDDVTKTALIKVGDRLNAVYTMDGDLIQMIPTPPGLYVTGAVPIFGLGGQRNLLEVSFASRDTGEAIGD